MTLKEDIEKQYEAILPLAEEHDSFFEEKKEELFGSRSLAVKEDSKAKYRETRSKLELQLVEWMAVLRKSLNDIPSSEKKFKTETRTDFGAGETYTEKEYDNRNFAEILEFFDRIQHEVEWRNGILAGIKESRRISGQLRNIRGDVLSFSHTLDLFIPEKMISIEKQVEITLKLRELGLEKVAEEIEGIEEEDDNLKKCLKARTALEQIVVNFCEKNAIKPTKFHFNLASAVEKGMTEKAQQKSIAAHYSFVSKIIHKEIDADSKNTQYAIYGVINIIGSLIQKKS
jgi:hypothetical protein